MFQRIVANFQGAQKRYEQLEGKQYLVVPAVMLTEGVHTGSQGPLFYSREQLGRNVPVWNMKPVVVHHPERNGEAVSACSPDIIANQGVGFLTQSTATDTKLKTEAWIDETKLGRLAPQVLDDLHNNKPVEVSTGLWNDLDPTPGVFNGERYIGSVMNIQPDHLAILPDQKGACSVEKGAGLLQNKNAAVELSYDDIREQIRTQLRARFTDYCYVADVYPKFAVYESLDKCYKIAYSIKNGKVSLSKEAPEEVRKVTSYMTANRQLLVHEQLQGPLSVPAAPAQQLSNDMKRQQAQTALQQKYGGMQQDGSWGGWVVDLYANYVIWAKDGKHFRLPYTYDDDKINFTADEPEEVERISEYRTKTNTPIDGTSSPPNLNQEKQMTQTNNAIHQGAGSLVREAASGLGNPASNPAATDGQARIVPEARKVAINGMISSGAATESDRSSLEKMDDATFESIRRWATRGATQAIVPYTYEGVGDRSSVHNAQPQAKTVNQYIDSAPPEIQEILRNSLAEAEAVRGRYIQMIVNNKSNRFHPEWLKKQPLSMLKGLAALAGDQPRPAGPSYAGQGDVPMFIDEQQQVNNADNDAGSNLCVLPIPSIFSAPDKK